MFAHLFKTNAAPKADDDQIALNAAQHAQTKAVIDKLVFERNMHNADVPKSMHIDASQDAVIAQLIGEIRYEMGQAQLSRPAAIQAVLYYHATRPLHAKSPDEARQHVAHVRRMQKTLNGKITPPVISHTLYRATGLISKYV